MSIAAIIVAAGSSQRMGFDKLAADLRGRPVLAHSVAAFCAVPSIDEIFVVCPADRFATLLFGPFSKPVHRIDGGSSRQHSVHNGLLALSPGTTHVAVHDGARPLISPHEIEHCLELTRIHGACALGRRVTETLKRSDPEGFARSSVERENLWFMETPQCFHVPTLLRAYQHVTDNHLIVTDEVSAMEAIGIPTFLVESKSPNLKITVPADLKLAAYWMDAAKEMR
jgi:2-C-methyl-D-erythritol 4-phosphate cytidylyltransferase